MTKASTGNARFYDNTRLSEMKRCPRRYYFRHVRNWTPAGPTDTPLLFGACWHSAMDTLWPMLADGAEQGDAIKAAHRAFSQRWIDEGGPENIDYEMEKEMSPRTPSRALDMLITYVEKRASQLAEGFEIISIEKPFIIPLDLNDNLYYIAKIDKVVAHKNKIIGIEHKTTTAYSKGQTFRPAFLDSFSPNAQVDGYLFALHMTFPDRVGGIWVDAALVHKTEEGFIFIPVEKNVGYLDAWLWETRVWVDTIEANMARLAETSPDDSYMAAFPRNTNSCFDFNKACPFLLPCRSWGNPVGKQLPPDMKEEVWDPLDRVDREDVEKQLGNPTSESDRPPR